MTGARLEFDRLNKRYGDVVALRDMTFDVSAGEIFGFVGSNGAGKTTAMRIALGVLAADSGEVRWDGQAIDLQTRRHIGYMPEERGLYPKMKVGEQLIYFARLHGMSVAAATQAARAWTEELGVDTRWGDELQKLSLGNQQRVQLAAALVHNPTILVLDEPFSGLDPVAVDVMSKVLADRAAAGVPVVFSSHQLDLVQRLCHRVGIVSRGRMVEIGSVKELRAGGARSLVVTAPAAHSGWATVVPGVTVDSERDGTAVLKLAGDVDDQAVLAAALATGPVTEFRWELPTLADLFRDVVSEDQAEQEGAAA